MNDGVVLGLFYFFYFLAFGSGELSCDLLFFFLLSLLLTWNLRLSLILPYYYVGGGGGRVVVVVVVGLLVF